MCLLNEPTTWGLVIRTDFLRILEIILLKERQTSGLLQDYVAHGENTAVFPTKEARNIRTQHVVGLSLLPPCFRTE